MKYLVVCDMNSGYAEISNVLMVEAESEQKAKEQARELQKHSTSRGYEAYRLDEIEAPWAFYW